MSSMLRTGCMGFLAVLAAATGPTGRARAQAPTIESQGMMSSGTLAAPGGTQSLLGPMPGGGANLGTQPGRDEMLFGGRVGPSFPRAPASITTPGGTYQGPRAGAGIAAPQPLPVPQPPFYGTLEVGEGAEDQGPPDGLTLDQAIDLYVHENLNLRALALELPQARADIITASLRANPILYGDAQLVPYKRFDRDRPGGPTQYDLNVSHPLDYARKRLARTDYARLALNVMEYQYLDAVRRGIGDLYMAYVDVLAARRTVYYAQVNARGVEELRQATEQLYNRAQVNRADLEQARSEGAVASVSLSEAEEALRQRKRILAALLNLPPADADRFELRGSLEAPGPPPPSEDDLYQLALGSRPDVVAYRRGVDAAQSAYRLARANRYADAYLLYQPYTFQDNSPYGEKSATSWALGITVPLPVYNRNQGNIERARINIHQSRVQLSDRERQVIAEVQQAIAEYRVSGRTVAEIRDRVLPPLKRALADREKLFREGESDIFAYLNQKRALNDRARAYLDSAARHRKAVLTLNTVVGQRVLP